MKICCNYSVISTTKYCFQRESLQPSQACYSALMLIQPIPHVGAVLKLRPLTESCSVCNCFLRQVESSMNLLTMKDATALHDAALHDTALHDTALHDTA